MAQNQITEWRGFLQKNSRKFIACGVLAMSLALSGCSAMNMTGFSFPVFGLSTDSSEKSDALTTSSMQEESQLSGAPSQKLMSQ